MRSALNHLLWSEIREVTTLSLSAVGSLWWKSGVALSADHLIALVLSGEGSKSWVDLLGSHTTSSKSEHQMESGLLLDVVIRKSSSIFELLSSEDESLLIGRNSLFVLDFGPKIIMLHCKKQLT